jgi:Flp pilus assembly secretin CpaC
MKWKLLAVITLLFTFLCAAIFLGQHLILAETGTGAGIFKQETKTAGQEQYIVGQVWVSVDFVQLDKKDFGSVEKELGFLLDPICGKVMLKPDEKKKLMEAIEKAPSADFLGSASLMTLTGGQGQTQLVEEIRYVTDQTEYKETKKGDETTKEPVVNRGIETRETGVLLTATPTVSTDEKIITLVLFPEVSLFNGWVKPDPSLISQPIFTSWNMTTTVYIEDGMTFVTKGVPSKAINRSQVIEPGSKSEKMEPKISLIICSGKMVPIKWEKSK